MKDDFDFEPEFDLEDEFQDELSEFDDLIEEGENVVLRTAILQKNNMTALLCIKSATAGAAICRVDPREAMPAVQLYDDKDAALEWFSKSLRTSKLNGWSVVYDGLPLEG